MGRGEVYQEPSGNWAVRWRENGHRRYRGGLASKAFADRVLATIRGNLAAQRAGIPPDPSIVPTLGELATGLPRAPETDAPGRGRGRGPLEEPPRAAFRPPPPGRGGHGEASALRRGEARRGAEPGARSGSASRCSRRSSNDLQERNLATVEPGPGPPAASIRRLMQADARPAHDAVHREARGRAPHPPRAPGAAEHRLRHRRARGAPNRRGLRPPVVARRSGDAPHPRPRVGEGAAQGQGLADRADPRRAAARS